MAIQIINAGANIKIVVNGSARIVAKGTVKSIRIVGDNIKLHADGCCGAPFEYLPFSAVDAPVTASIEALRDAIGDMLSSGTTPGVPAGISTEAMQVVATGKMDDILVKLQEINHHKSTNSNQIGQINHMVNMYNTMTAHGSIITGIMTALMEVREALRLQTLFHQPLRTWNQSQTEQYEGFALPGTQDNEPQWAIRRGIVLPDETLGFAGVVFSWANGSKSFNNAWTDRLTLTYS